MTRDAAHNFSEVCRMACGTAWEDAVWPPFVERLSRGTLECGQVSVYLDQDRIYLEGFVRVCRALAGMAGDAADRDLFLESARLSEEAEVFVQGELRAQLGLGIAPTSRPGTATRAYIEHERRCSSSGDRLVALAAAVPCNWTYAEIGRRLLKVVGPKNLPGHPLGPWIALYAGEEVQTLAAAWIDCLDRWGAAARPEDRATARDAFVRSVQCELAFWDQAMDAGPPPASA